MAGALFLVERFWISDFLGLAFFWQEFVDLGELLETPYMLSSSSPSAEMLRRSCVMVCVWNFDSEDGSSPIVFLRFFFGFPDSSSSPSSTKSSSNDRRGVTKSICVRVSCFRASLDALPYLTRVVLAGNRLCWGGVDDL